MKKWIVVLLAFGLMFAGCNRGGDQNTPPEAQKSGTAKKAVEATSEAPSAAVAQTGEEDPVVKNCLQLVSEAKFSEALPVCLDALKKHPANDQVKKAVESAQAAVGNAAADATGAAQGAQEAAGKKAEGALGEATGSLP